MTWVRGTCESCEEATATVRVDSIERGEGFTSDLCAGCLADLRIMPGVEIESVEDLSP